MEWKTSETIEHPEAKGWTVKPDSSPSRTGRISGYSLKRFKQIRGIEAPQAREAFHIIKDLDELIEAVLEYGEFDLVARIEVRSREGLDQVIFINLRKIKGIGEVTSPITAHAHLG